MAAYVLVVLAAAYVASEAQKRVDRKIVSSQLAACGRDNILRAQLNYETDLIRKFMLQAVKTTQASRDARVRAESKNFQKDAAGLLDVSIPQCEKVIFRP